MATYPALILIIGAMIAITQQTKAIGAAKLIRVLADYSFTLYLIHYTIMMAASDDIPCCPRLALVLRNSLGIERDRIFNRPAIRNAAPAICIMACGPIFFGG